MDALRPSYDSRWKGGISLTQPQVEMHSPIRKNFLPFHKSWIGEEEKQEVLDTLESGWLTKGPKTKEFEKQFAEFIGVPYAVGVNSCTAALHLGLVALGVKPGDEVITTPITFAATVNVIEHCGAKPVFVDIEEDTFNINPKLIEKAVTNKTKVILPVHFAGQMCRMDEIMKIAKKHNAAVLEDAAHAVEADYKGKAPGVWGDIAAFSFYATKNITTGEGGMLLTKDAGIAERVEILSLHGLSRDAWKRYGNEGFRDWEILEAGFKYNMFDLQASIGIHQLRKVNIFWEKRKQLVEYYNEALREILEVTPLTIHNYGKHAHHLYVIRLNLSAIRQNREECLDRLQHEGIGVGIHFKAVHLHPYYKSKYNIPLGSFPVAEQVSNEILSLPLYPLMTLEDAKDVVGALKKVLKK